RLFGGRLNWGDTMKSDYIRRRMAQMPPVVQQALEGLASAKPGRAKHLARRMGESISGADALFTAGTYAIVYDYQVTQAQKMGMEGKAASEHARETAERITDRIAQPTRAGARSYYEATATSPQARLLWAFASEARQKTMLAAYAIAEKP